jgi:ABC-type dipeptide/oligopeptide/nickel transport system permease component
VTLLAFASVWNHFSVKDTWIDRLIALVSTLGMSIPRFQSYTLPPAAHFERYKYTNPGT